MTGDDRGPLSSLQLTAAIKESAILAGFDRVGIAPAVAPPGLPSFLQWLDSGFAGEMQYLERRRDAYGHPNGVMQGAKSCVMLLLNYNHGANNHGPNSRSSRDVEHTHDHNHDDVPAQMDEPAAQPVLVPGRVSRYAWGRSDYHDLIRLKLTALSKSIKSLAPGVRTRGCVDTAPLLERDFARFAGLGWFGKNSMLLNKQLGSWFFIAAMLLDLELTYDPPHESAHCGTCTSCLTACPTDAFAGPGVLDARRCISYFTIELRGPIPVEFREQMGDWLFGCDVCQDVCPWNRKSPQSLEPAFAPRADLRPADAAELLRLDDAAFEQRFMGTPLFRPGRSGLLRNAAIVLGNAGDPAAIPVLCGALNDVEPVIRGAAAWGLGQIGGPSVIAALNQRQKIEADETVLAEIAAATAAALNVRQ